MLLFAVFVSFVSAYTFNLHEMAHVTEISQAPPVTIPYISGSATTESETKIGSGAPTKSTSNSTLWTVTETNKVRSHSLTAASGMKLENYLVQTTSPSGNFTEIWSITNGGPCTRQKVPTPKTDCGNYEWKSETFKGKASQAAKIVCKANGGTTTLTTYYNPAKTAVLGNLAEINYPSLSMVIKATTVFTTFSSDKFGDDKVTPPSTCPTGF